MSVFSTAEMRSFFWELLMNEVDRFQWIATAIVAIIIIRGIMRHDREWRELLSKAESLEEAEKGEKLLKGIRRVERLTWVIIVVSAIALLHFIIS